MIARFLAIGLVGLISAGRPVAAASARVLVPWDRTVVVDDTLLILGTAPRGSRIPWSAESPSGRVEDHVRADWGDVFEIFLILDPGLNVIRVGDETLRVFYDDGSAPVPRGFRTVRAHAGDVSRCSDCHDPLSMELQEGGYPGVCLVCHVVVSSNPDNPNGPEGDPHFQKAVARCGRCHRPHASDDPKLLREDRVAVCTRCHAGRDLEKGRHVRGQEGGCAVCHDPHYSGYPKLLLEGLPGLCGRCHDEGMAPGRPHAPVRSGDACSTCHDPHGSGGGLLRAGPTELCSRCHPGAVKEGHGASLGACTACHDPHGGADLLKGEAETMCRRCHGDVGRGRTVHTALEEGCQTCHDPHRDGDRKAARASCASCHDTAQGELAGLHGYLALPPGACTACHPPHSSEGPRLLTGKLHPPVAQGKCTVCHGGGTDRSLKVIEAARRCRMCHAFERGLSDRGERVHDPVAEGRCTACHDPHLSTQPKLLRADQPGVCGRCHAEAVVTGEKERHPPARRCTACHGAHGGPLPAFLKAGAPALCLECHDDPRKGPGELHPALEEGCLVCHDPHAGTLPGYMAGSPPGGPCLECHDVLSDVARLHPALERGCSACHEPHRSERVLFLRKPGNALCRECHDTANHPHTLDRAGAARFPEAARFPVDGGEFGCTGCHDPHGGEGKGLWVRPKEVLCKECHKV